MLQGGLFDSAPTITLNSSSNPLLGSLTDNPITDFNTLVNSPEFTAASAADGGGVFASNVLSGLDPNTFPLPPIPPVADDVGIFATDALSGAGGAAEGVEAGAGGLGFLTDTTGNVANVGNDITSIFSSGTGFGQLATDIANPVAGLAGGLLGKILAPQGKSGGQTIGSAVGGGAAALAGLLGAPLGPLGVFGGALIGSLIGGGFGPNQKNTYSFAGLKLNPDGTLALGNQVEQAYSGNSVRDPIQSQIDAFNNYLIGNNLKITNPTVAGNALSGEGNFITGGVSGPISLGIDLTKSDTGAQQTTNLGSSIGDIFAQLRFESADPAVNAKIAGKEFSNVDLLSTVLGGGDLPAPAPVPEPGSFTYTDAAGNTTTNSSNNVPLVDPGTLSPQQQVVTARNAIAERPQDFNLDPMWQDAIRTAMAIGMNPNDVYSQMQQGVAF